MPRNPRPVRIATPALVLMAAVAWSGLLGSRPAGGQDDWDAAEEEEKPLAPVQMAAPAFQASDFERWVFGGRNPDQAKQTLMNRFSVVLDSVERACDLTEGQRKKLELAAQGDVKRFFEEVEEVRGTFDKLKDDRQRLNEIFQLIRPLQAKLRSSFFDDDSLLYKVLKNTLEPGQARQYEQQDLKRRKFLYEAKIELTLTMVESGVPLRESQRKQLVKMLLEETEPPARFGQQPYYQVLYQVGKLDDEKLRPIFDDAQWQAIERTVERAEGMEAHLRRNGLIP